MPGAGGGFDLKTALPTDENNNPKGNFDLATALPIAQRIINSQPTEIRAAKPEDKLNPVMEVPEDDILRFQINRIADKAYETATGEPAEKALWEHGRESAFTEGFRRSSIGQPLENPEEAQKHPVSYIAGSVAGQMAVVLPMSKVTAGIIPAASKLLGSSQLFPTATRIFTHTLHSFLTGVGTGAVQESGRQIAQRTFEPGKLIKEPLWTGLEFAPWGIVPGTEIGASGSRIAGDIARGVASAGAVGAGSALVTVMRKHQITESDLVDIGINSITAALLNGWRGSQIAEANRNQRISDFMDSDLLNRVKIRNPNMPDNEARAVAGALKYGIMNEPAIVRTVERKVYKVQTENTLVFSGKTGDVLGFYPRTSLEEVPAGQITQGPKAGGIPLKLPDQLLKWREKGVHPVERLPIIRISQDTAKIKDMAGNIIEFPRGREVWATRQSNGYYHVTDMFKVSILAERGQYENLKNQNVVLGQQPLEVTTKVRPIVRGEKLTTEYHLVADPNAETVERRGTVGIYKTPREAEQAQAVWNSRYPDEHVIVKRVTGVVNNTKHSRYVLPGGNNYREVVLQYQPEEAETKEFIGGKLLRRYDLTDLPEPRHTVVEFGTRTKWEGPAYTMSWDEARRRIPHANFNVLQYLHDFKQVEWQTAHIFPYSAGRVGHPRNLNKMIIRGRNMTTQDTYDFVRNPGQGTGPGSTIIFINGKRHSVDEALGGHWADRIPQETRLALPGPQETVTKKVPTLFEVPQHWPEKNPLSHYRSKDYELNPADIEVDSNKDFIKVRLIEEMQSDWNTRGRERGFKGEIKLPEDWSLRKINQQEADELGSSKAGNWALIDETGEFVAHAPGELSYQDALKAVVQDATESGVNVRDFGITKGDIPYVPELKDWLEITLKQAIVDAVEDGVDGIAFTTGDQQAKRWSLTTYIDSIVYEPTTNPSGQPAYGISAYKGGHAVGRYITIDEDKLAEYGFSPETVGQIKRREGKVTNRGFRIDIPTLRLEKTWAHTLYDSQIPSTLRDIVKKWGGKITTINMNDQVIRIERMYDHVSGELQPYNIEMSLKQGASLYSDKSTHDPLTRAEIMDRIPATKRRDIRDWMDDLEFALETFNYPDAKEGLTVVGVQPYLEITPQLREMILTGGQPMAGGMPSENAYEANAARRKEEMRALNSPEITNKLLLSEREFLSLYLDQGKSLAAIAIDLKEHISDVRKTERSVYAKMQEAKAVWDEERSTGMEEAEQEVLREKQAQIISQLKGKLDPALKAEGEYADLVLLPWLWAEEGKGHRLDTEVGELTQMTGEQVASEGEAIELIKTYFQGDIQARAEALEARYNKAKQKEIERQSMLLGRRKKTEAPEIEREITNVGDGSVISRPEDINYSDRKRIFAQMPFALLGNKAEVISRLPKALKQALTAGVTRVYDLWGGAKGYRVGLFDKLPAQDYQLNELSDERNNYYRNVTTPRRQARMKAELNRLLNQFTEIMNRAFELPATETNQEFHEMANTWLKMGQQKERYLYAKEIIQEWGDALLETARADKFRSPESSAKYYFLENTSLMGAGPEGWKQAILRTLKGKSTLFNVVSRIMNLYDNLDSELKRDAGMRVSKQDAWVLMDKITADLQAGVLDPQTTVVTVDPQYLNPTNEQTYTVGLSDTNWLGHREHLKDHLLPLIKTGVKIIYTNNADYELVKWLKENGIPYNIERAIGAMGNRGGRDEVIAFINYKFPDSFYAGTQQSMGQPDQTGTGSPIQQPAAIAGITGQSAGFSRWLELRRQEQEKIAKLRDLAVKKGLVYTDYKGKKHDRLQAILKTYQGATQDQLIDYITALLGSPGYGPRLFKLTGDIEKDTEALKLIAEEIPRYRDINKMEMNTLDPPRIIEKVTGKDAWDNNALYDNTQAVLEAAFYARFDRLAKERQELEDATGIKPGSEESATLMQKFEGQTTASTKLYRGGPASAIPKGLSAQDVIDYETKTLGNKDIKIEKGINLKDINAERLMWLTTSKEAAEEYGEAVEIVVNNYRIIAQDSEGGILIEKLDKHEGTISMSASEQAAVKFLRTKWDMWIAEANQIRQMLNIRPIAYRKDYMTHIAEYNMLNDFFKGDIKGMDKISVDQLEAIRKGDYTKGYKPFNQFALKRKGDKTRFDAIGNYLKYVDTITKEIYYSPAIKHAQQYIDYALQRQPNAYKAYDRLLRDVKGKSMADQNIWETLYAFAPIKFLNTRIGQNALIGNVNFWLTNMSNFSTASGEIGPYVISGMKQFITDKATREWAFKNSKMLQSRRIDPYLDEKLDLMFDILQKTATKTGAKGLVSLMQFSRAREAQLVDFLESITNYIEFLNVGSTFCGAYTKAVEKMGMSQSKAIEYADAIARRTQTGYHPYQVPAHMRSGAGKLLSKFQTWSFNAMNHIIYDLKAGNIPKELLTRIKLQKVEAQDKARWKALLVLLATSILVNSVYKKFGLRQPYRATAAVPNIPFVTAGRYEQPPIVQLTNDITTAIKGKTPQAREKAIRRILTETLLSAGGTQVERLLEGDILPPNKKKVERGQLR